jgi:hypothetical protein
MPKFQYEFVNGPKVEAATDCKRCEVRVPHIHINDSGPICDNDPHQDWCIATHHEIYRGPSNA